MVCHVVDGVPLTAFPRQYCHWSVHPRPFGGGKYSIETYTVTEDGCDELQMV